MYTGEEIKQQQASQRVNILKGFSEVQELQKGEGEWLGVKEWGQKGLPLDEDDDGLDIKDGKKFDTHTNVLPAITKGTEPNICLSADDFESGRLNKSFFTNIVKGMSEEAFLLTYPADKFNVFEKATVEGYIRDTYEKTGGEIVKGSFNDTEEVASILENMRSQVSLIKAVHVETKSGEVVPVFVLEKAVNVEGKEDDQDSLEKADLEDEGKSIQNNLEKGVYADNAQNRKLGRVGNKFGKEDDNSGADAHNKKVQAKKELSEGYEKYKKTDAYKTLKEHNKSDSVRKRHAEVHGKELDDDEYDTEVENWMKNNYEVSIHGKDEIKKAIDSDDEDSDSIEKGVIHDTVNYGNIDLSFAKTGAEIKDKLDAVVQEETAKLNILQTKINVAAAKQVYVPTESGYGSDDVTYRTYRWDMTYLPDDNSSKVIKLSDTENGTLTKECCDEHREWNDLIYKFRDCKKELDTINLLLRNLDDKKSYKLTARQMLDFGF